jgi:hypothetical protein
MKWIIWKVLTLQRKFPSYDSVELKNDSKKEKKFLSKKWRDSSDKYVTLLTK